MQDAFRRMIEKKMLEKVQAELAKRREQAEYREETISYEPDITIFNKTK